MDSAKENTEFYIGLSRTAFEAILFDIDLIEELRGQQGIALGVGGRDVKSDAVVSVVVGTDHGDRGCSRHGGTLGHLGDDYVAVFVVDASLVSGRVGSCLQGVIDCIIVEDDIGRQPSLPTGFAYGVVSRQVPPVGQGGAGRFHRHRLLHGEAPSG